MRGWCLFAQGHWLKKPTDIAVLGSTVFAASAASLTEPLIANCTWKYRNNATSPRNWTFFAAVTWTPLGSTEFGAGTNDVINDEETELGESKSNGQENCLWAQYAASGPTWDQCWVDTKTTWCQPENNREGVAPAGSKKNKRKSKKWKGQQSKPSVRTWMEPHS